LAGVTSEKPASRAVARCHRQGAFDRRYKPFEASLIGILEEQSGRYGSLGMPDDPAVLHNNATRPEPPLNDPQGRERPDLKREVVKAGTMRIKPTIALLPQAQEQTVVSSKKRVRRRRL
jgi:hypothetical protein